MTMYEETFLKMMNPSSSLYDKKIADIINPNGLDYDNWVTSYMNSRSHFLEAINEYIDIINMHKTGKLDSGLVSYGKRGRHKELNFHYSPRNWNSDVLQWFYFAKNVRDSRCRTCGSFTHGTVFIPASDKAKYQATYTGPIEDVGWTTQRISHYERTPTFDIDGTEYAVFTGGDNLALWYDAPWVRERLKKVGLQNLLVDEMGIEVLDCFNNKRYISQFPVTDLGQVEHILSVALMSQIPYLSQVPKSKFEIRMGDKVYKISYSEARMHYVPGLLQYDCVGCLEIRRTSFPTLMGNNP